jgi:hypothetical protein
MRTLLICHHDEPLHFDGLARWLASFSDLVGILIVADPPRARLRRLRREYRRSGIFGTLDALAFRLWYRFRLARRDRQHAAAQFAAIRRQYGDAHIDAPRCTVSSPNSPSALEFVHHTAPDIIIALCKHMLKPDVFSSAPLGTWVFHPGICPEYRNAHGCFWALVNRDLTRVGMTLLRIDEGIDTGPVYGYFSYAYDERTESHIIIQRRVVLDNLDGIRDVLLGVQDATASAVDVSARASRVWGQPRLTAYVRWRLLRWKEARASARS